MELAWMRYWSSCELLLAWMRNMLLTQSRDLVLARMRNMLRSTLLTLKPRPQYLLLRHPRLLDNRRSPTARRRLTNRRSRPTRPSRRRMPDRTSARTE